MVHGRNKSRRPCFGISTRLWLVALLAVSLVYSVVSAEAGAKKGSVAFHYAASLTDEERSWLQRFEIVVPAAILPQSQIDRLHEAGSRLFFYEWATGLYIDNP